MRGLFAPKTPYAVEAEERDRIAKKTPHLSLVSTDPRPEPDMFRWWSLAELMERRP